MALIVEDGTGKPDANSYVSLAVALDYAQTRGIAAWTADGAADATRSAALIRATAFIDATYRGRFPGYRTQGRRQGLEWPRVGAYTYVPDDGRSGAYLSGGYGATQLDAGYSYILPNEIPREIIAATCEAAGRELAEPGLLAPDLDRGGAIQSLSAGSVSITYAVGASARTTFQAIDKALASLLMPRNEFSGRVARG